MKPRRAALGLVVVALIAAACSRGNAAETTTSTALTTLPPVATAPATTTSSTTSTTTSSTTTTTTTTLPPSPLNGLGVEDEELLEHRVVAVKIDNHPSARPQSGLEQADAVYELLVEGGLTRFIGLFHVATPTYVGPIRSARPTDPTLVRYMDAPVQISGGQGWVLARFRAEGVNVISDDRVSTFRIGGRRAPHNLYGNVEKMRSTADRRGWSDEAPAPIFDFGEASPAAWMGSEIVMDWSDRPVVRWEWDGEQYLRFNATTPHNWRSEDGVDTQISTDVLLVLEARRYTASPGAGNGTPVPALDTVGTGDAILFYGGKVIEGTWQRETTEERFELSMPNGQPMVLPPGRLWINIFPSQQTVSWS